MKTAFQVKWTAACALGLGIAFVAYLQIGMLVEFGLDFERHWQWQEQAVEANFLFYAVSFVALLVAGAVFERQFDAQHIDVVVGQAEFRGLQMAADRVEVAHGRLLPGETGMLPR